jgi:2,3-bisphosphoglycerate-dependent phosphoglycerate mutase
MQPTLQLVLMRHGYSDWNKSGRFTGWTDIPLCAQGIA